MYRSTMLAATAAIVTATFATVCVAAVDAGGLGGSDGARIPSKATDARQITVEGTSVRVSLWSGRDAQGDLAPHYTISLDGGETFSPPRATDYTIKLRYDEFDPLGFQVAREVAPAFASDLDTNLHVVQFVTQPLAAYRDGIAELDGTVLAYLAQHAYIVEMTPETRDAVAQLPYVRWVGAYHPAYRLEEFLIDNVDDAEALYPVGTYNVRVFTPEQKASLADAAAQLGGAIALADAGRQMVRVTLTAEQLFDLVRRDDVMFIDRYGELEADMDIARQIGGADALETIAGYDGSGVRGEVIDLGFNLAHVDFLSRPLIEHHSVGSDSHGAATSGIIFGDGTGDPTAKGLCHAAQGIVVSTSAMEGTSRYDNTGELVQDPYFAVFQSSSVGSPRTFNYNNESADMDDGLFDFDFVICQSQSNAGNQDSRPQAWAKNIISVGGVAHENTLTKTDDSWSAGNASVGPAADGRIKPDLCSFYDDIRTTTTGSSTSYTSSFGGTSGATPIVAGHVGLFMQMWSDGIFGNPVNPTGTVFENRPHASTCKAMMINTASQYSFSGSSHDLTRVHQGWGMPDLQSMYDLRFKMLIVDEVDVLANLDSTTYVVDVEAGEPALRATMVYADPGGTTSSSQHRINNLSLRVTSPGGTQYWGNEGLQNFNWSLPGGSENLVDTVENVFVQSPEAGQWMIEVIASEIVQDSHVETPQFDADYALVVSGVEEVLPALFVSLPVHLPSLVAPNTPVDLDVTISDGEEAVVPGSEMLHYRFDGGAFTSVPLSDLGGGSYLGTIPGASCGDVPEYYVSAQGDQGTVVFDPPLAPSLFETYDIGEEFVGYTQDFENATGWTVTNTAVTGGAWEVGVPAGDGLRGDPTVDFDGSGQCFLTQNGAGNTDVDGGPTTLTSELIDATAHTDPYISYARWFTKDDPAPDPDNFLVEVSDDDGASWSVVEDLTSPLNGWQVNTFRLLDHGDVTNQVRLRFSVTDNPNNTIVEAGVDAIQIVSEECDAGIPGDVNGDGVVNFGDILAVIGAWGACPGCPADVNGDDVVNFADILVVIGNWTG
ncbi:MAG: S8 family serine peptidase [Planctomycetota bacterium]|jgi:hypothetical protein